MCFLTINLLHACTCSVTALLSCSFLWQCGTTKALALLWVILKTMALVFEVKGKIKAYFANIMMSLIVCSLLWLDSEKKGTRHQTHKWVPPCHLFGLSNCCILVFFHIFILGGVVGN